MMPKNAKRCVGVLLLALLPEMAHGAPDPKVQAVQNAIGAARRLRDQKKWDEAINAAETARVMEGAVVTQKIDCYEIIIDVYRRQKKLDPALATAARIDREIPNIPEATSRSAALQGEITFDMGRKAESVAHFTNALQRSQSPHVKAACAFRIGSIESGEGRANEALAAFERVFTESTGAMDYWGEAQRGISDALRKAGRYPESLQAARIALILPADPNGIANNVQHIAILFKEADKNVTRANAWLAYQEFGPAGKDGTPGTADDLADPLAAVGYPNYPEREKAFAKLRASLGDDAAASRLRAWTYVYTAHPNEALAHFAETFRRAGTEGYQILPTINELIVVGARGVRGHAVGIEKFYQYMRLGPAGADGKAGTADDLKDPFAEIGLPPRVAKPDGGLTPPPEPQRKALADVAAVLEKLILAERDDSYSRQQLLGTLDRVHTALVDWGTTGQADWYQRLLFDATSNEYEYSTVLVGGLRAARGCDLHYGGVAEFWKKLDATSHWDIAKNWGQVQGYRGNAAGTLKLIETPAALNPKLPPLK